MWAKGKRERISRLAQDAYFYLICKGLVKVLECSISETAAHNLGPVAMREWRILKPPTGSDHEYGVQCILLDDRGSSSMSSSPTVLRMTVELLIGCSSGKPLADDLRGHTLLEMQHGRAWPPSAFSILAVLYI